MNTLDTIGLGLAITGIIIFIYITIIKPRFRKYYGINEYKKIRDKYINQETETEEETEEEEKSNTGILEIVSLIVGTTITLIVGNTVIKEVREATKEINATTIGGLTSETAINSIGTVWNVMMAIIIIIIIIKIVAVMRKIAWTTQQNHSYGRKDY